MRASLLLEYGEASLNLHNFINDMMHQSIIRHQKGVDMKMDRRVFTKTDCAAALALPSWAIKASAAKLPVNRVTKIRCYYPPNYQSNGPQAFPQSNMVVLVDTEAGITGIGQGGSPDTVRNMARSVIGKNAFDTEFIWQHGFMDGFYSPGKERLHALGAIDLALWDIKGKALQTPLYELFGGKARQHIELYATNGVPQGLVPQADLQRMSLKDAPPRRWRRLSRVPSGQRDRSNTTGGGAAAGRGRTRGRARGHAADTPVGVPRVAGLSTRARASARSPRRQHRFAKASVPMATG